MFEEEIEILKALAFGINYFTGEKCQNDSILNDANIIRTLYKVCDELKSISPKDVKKIEFVCPADIEEKFEYEDSLSLTQLLKKIAELYPNMKKLKYTLIADLLTEQGLLEKVENERGKLRTRATDKAKQYGISNVERVSMYGRPYQIVIYNKDGQKFVLSCIKNLKNI